VIIDSGGGMVFFASTVRGVVDVSNVNESIAVITTASSAPRALRGTFGRNK